MPLLELESEEPLFAVAYHPSKPEFVYGTGLGHVKYCQYDPSGESNKSVTILWETKRHKGSCRTVLYSEDGDKIYSAGSDGVIKLASAKSGKVQAKCRTNSAITRTVLTNHYLVCGTDEGDIYTYDKSSLKELFHLESVLESNDAITALFCLDHRGKNQFVAAAGDVVAQVDVTRGITKKSEGQEDEILDGCLVNEKHCAFAMSSGVVTIWNTDHLLDQQHRIKVAGSTDSVECVFAGRTEGTLIAGSSDGYVTEIEAASGKVLLKLLHSEAEEIMSLEWDYEYRPVSISLSKLVIWSEEDLESPESKPEAASSSKRKAKRAKKRATKEEPQSKSNNKPQFDL